MKIKIMMIIFITSFYATAVLRADWLMYKKDISRNAVIEDKTLDFKGFKEIWRFKTAGGVYATPLVYKNKLLFGSQNNIFYCLDRKAGTLIWQRKFGSFIYGSSAALYEPKDMVLVGSVDKNLYALSAGTGKILWKFETGDYVFASVLVCGKAVYFGSDDRFVYKLYADDGKLIWKTKLNDKIHDNSFAMQDNLLVTGDFSGIIYGIDSDNGTILWSYKTGAKMNTTPLIYNGQIFAGSEDKNLYAMDRGGKLKWKYKTDSFVMSPPSAAGNLIYFGAGNGEVFCVDMQGNKKWSSNIMHDYIFSCPLIVNDRVIFTSYSDSIYVFNRMTGELLFSYKLDGDIYASPYIDRGFLFIGTRSDTMFCLELTR